MRDLKLSNNSIRILLVVLAVIITTVTVHAQVNDPTRGLTIFGGRPDKSSTAIKRHVTSKKPVARSQSTTARPTKRNNRTTRKRTQPTIDYDNYSVALEKKAINGDAKAIETVGRAYLTGDGVEQDNNKALYFYDKGSDMGLNDMATIAGILHEQRGEGADAFRRFAQASNAGDAWGTYQLAWCYFDGVGTDVNLNYGAQLLEQAANGNDDDAQHDLGMLCLNGNKALGVQQDVAKGMTLLNKSATNDNDAAWYELGNIYLNGLYGYSADTQKAFDYLMRSAKFGNGDAMNLIGTMYQNGIYVSKDNSQAFDWYQKASDAGSSDGQYNLGRAYMEGQLVSTNYELSLKYLTYSAMQGNPHGQYGMALCYEYGYGANKDLPTALNLYAKAASQGLDAALSKFGFFNSSFCISGQTNGDWLAYEMFRIEAKVGDPWGMFYFGRCLYEGVGHTKDKKLGAYWIWQASEKNYQSAIEYISQNKLKKSNISAYKANQIFDEQTGNEKKAIDILLQWGRNNSDIDTQNPTYTFAGTMPKIYQIKRTDYGTIVSFYNKSEREGDGFAINRNTHIIADGQEYKLVDVSGIDFIPNWTRFDYVGQIKYFALLFSPIPRDTKSFDLIESTGADQWQFYNVECTAKQ